MKILFAGTPEFAVPTLRMLLASEHEVVAVYTRPDRPAGRGRQERQSSVKSVAAAQGIRVCQPESFKSDEAVEELRAFQAELLVVVAYGLILPRSVLDEPKLGCVNVHASLLPRWRGAAPIPRAIYAGDEETGVTIMFMEPTLDTGPMILKARTPIHPLETAAELHDRLAVLGADAMKECLPGIAAATVKAEIQDDSQATFAQKLEKSEAAMDWSLPAIILERRVRAFNPWPVAETVFNGKVLRVWQAQAIDAQPAGQAGEVVCGEKTLDVATGSGVLRLLEVQLPGGKRLRASEFLNAHRMNGVRLGASA